MQAASVVHSTQVPLTSSQTGRRPAQSPEPAHGTRQRRRPRSHVPLSQSASTRQSTQRESRESQTRPASQSAAATHSTQRRVVTSQLGLSTGQ